MISTFSQVTVGATSSSLLDRKFPILRGAFRNFTNVHHFRAVFYDFGIIIIGNRSDASRTTISKKLSKWINHRNEYFHGSWMVMRRSVQSYLFLPLKDRLKNLKVKYGTLVQTLRELIGKCEWAHEKRSENRLILKSLSDLYQRADL